MGFFCICQNLKIPHKSRETANSKTPTHNSCRDTANYRRKRGAVVRGADRRADTNCCLDFRKNKRFIEKYEYHVEASPRQSKLGMMRFCFKGLDQWSAMNDTDIRSWRLLKVSRFLESSRTISEHFLNQNLISPLEVLLWQLAANSWNNILLCSQTKTAMENYVWRTVSRLVVMFSVMLAKKYCL